MARYRKVDIRMWGDAKFRTLSPVPPCGQALWFYLLTGRETGIIPGLSSAGEAAMAEQLGWPLAAFREAFAEVSARAMAQADWKARVVWIPNAIKYNPPASPNVIRGWTDAWDEIPECALKVAAFHRLRAFAEGMGPAFARAFAEACPLPPGEGSAEACQEQDHDQEQDQDQDREQEPVPQPLPEPRPPQLQGSASPRDRAPELAIAFPDGDGTGTLARWIARTYPDIRDPAAFARAQRAAYPDLDLIGEGRRALAWETSNPGRRKRDHGRFLNAWFARARRGPEQERAAVVQPPSPAERFGQGGEVDL